MDKHLVLIEGEILQQMAGKFTEIADIERRVDMLTSVAKKIDPKLEQREINEIIDDINNLDPITQLLLDDEIEDIMINNTEKVFTFNAKKGLMRIDYRMENRDMLKLFVAKLKLYMTNQEYKGNIMDIHLPNGSRANIVSSPVGQDITIRNMKHPP